ncbi:DUF1176 domain-containing protein [Sphingorhabdus pulchriflava]|uniref:DUF1176 domain-containing protein n=1 Tax=Sphingorhabdus pulchriflava TaxID=2292257 RepID=A0A371BI45_9SPHN|nr:DUF1176 domain-containing protein [Sphingorhabdus pulchriflava]RDV07274.1 DUF1176 domain-containing protein [Sphingorhabdus pulchriflava]
MPKWRLIAALALFATWQIHAEDSPPGDWTAPEVMEFGDWSVACDNARECTAVSVSRDYLKRIESVDPGDYAMPKLWVKRRAGPSQQPRVFVDGTVWGKVDPEPDVAALLVYYECDGDCTGRAYNLKRIESGRYELDPAQAAAFFAESVKTSRAATRHRNGAMHGIISTSGLTAAMRYIDESQQRRDTVTAVYAKGKRQAIAVPPEPRRPTVKVVRGVEEPVPETYDYTTLNQKRGKYCPIFGGTNSDPPIQRFKLNNGQALWAAGCGSNPHYEKRIWLIETTDNQFKVFTLPRPEQGRPAELPILPNSDFDPASGQITSYSGGMCGWRRRWAWTGSAFEMVDSIEMPACIDILPNQWLQTYRAIPE